MADVEGFVMGDSRKALRCTLVDSIGQRIDLTGGAVRLFAIGQGSGDRPTSNPNEVTWNGVLGVLVDAPAGIVDFQGFGALCDTGADDRDTYDIQVRFVDAAARTGYSYPTKTASVVRPLSSLVVP